MLAACLSTKAAFFLLVVSPLKGLRFSCGGVGDKCVVAANRPFPCGCSLHYREEVFLCAGAVISFKDKQQTICGGCVFILWANRVSLDHELGIPCGCVEVLNRRGCWLFLWEDCALL